MADELAKRVRASETLTALNRLERDVGAWIEHRRDRDHLRQYATPLATLERTLLGAVGSLQREAGALPLRMPLGDLYAKAANLDRRAALVRKVWAWFQVKFDQRDQSDQLLISVLAAADEVVWSCWKEAFDSATLSGGLAAPRGPAPLPYIDPEGGAEAFVRDEPPSGLAANEADQALGRFLVRLPVPVVRLPVGCLDSPWSLALLAHEVGHHLQYDLLPGGALVAEVGNLVAGAVSGGPTEEARWRGWSRELFADACALLALGPAAISVTLRVELGDEATLLNPARGRYPAPAVRLALLAELARTLHLDPLPALGSFGDPAALAAPRETANSDAGRALDGPAAPAADPLDARRRRVRADLEQVPKVAAALLEAPFGGLGPLPRLFRFKPADHGPAGRYAVWADAIARGRAHPEPTLRAAREAVAGAVLAWQRLAAIADDHIRASALARLAEDLPALLAASRQAGTRTGDGEHAPQDLGGELAALLRETIPEGAETPVGG
ncbi:MAG TPA: hypothetical protein VE664_06645 [Actinomycetes bacterium]|jgi:hypothetical protein|nr:hypothetical protein [Actinomycetes bacterium]